jgi:hypothetical protein
MVSAFVDADCDLAQRPFSLATVPADADLV